MEDDLHAAIGRLIVAKAELTGEEKFIDSIGDGEGNMTTGPVAVDDRASVVAGESETIAVLDNDFHTEGLLFGVTSFEGQTENGGTVTRDDNGTAHLMDDKLVYTPAAGFTGEDSFIYSTVLVMQRGTWLQLQ
ncbi:MAG: Ig-like domain-containing protein [Hormoscilla sp. GM102CHS1]|nr:Ig-like domain-containing protein [Hormoscilla sp. GM102CHS1]